MNIYLKTPRENWLNFIYIRLFYLKRLPQQPVSSLVLDEQCPLNDSSLRWLRRDIVSLLFYCSSYFVRCDLRCDLRLTLRLRLRLTLRLTLRLRLRLWLRLRLRLRLRLTLRLTTSG